MKTFFKKLLPPVVRLQLRLLYIQFRDVLQANKYSFVKYSLQSISKGEALNPILSITQPIKKTAYSDNKRHNLQLAISRIHNMSIQPQEVFSFWKLIGNPSQKKGYKIGRSIVGDELSANVGGGLCQLSGILYYLAIQLGLQIIERHTHSYDLYTEESRYTPLGSDATVAYGYKDLRFINSLSTPICFRFRVVEDSIKALLCTASPQTVYDITYDIEHMPNGKKVRSYQEDDTGNKQLIDDMFYLNYTHSTQHL